MLDINKLSQTNFSRRKAKIPVPDLARFFPEGEVPEWEVAGLTGQELGACNEAVGRRERLAAIVSGIVSDKPDDIKEAVERIMGTSNTSDDTAKRISLLTFGSVSPKVTESQAVEFCTYYPVEFYQLTTKILHLTGMGFDPGE